jgi:hypothetical protein
LEKLQELAHKFLKRPESADVLLGVSVRSLSLQRQMELHDHRLLLFRQTQSLRPVIHGPYGPELLDMRRHIRVIGIFEVSVPHDVVREFPTLNRGFVGNTCSFYNSQ